MVNNKWIILLGIIAIAKAKGGRRNASIIDVVNDLPHHPTLRYPTRNLGDITQIIIHHAAVEQRFASCNAEAFANYHINSRGWAGIGYHIVIEKDGAIKLCNYLTTISNNIGNANTRSIGICLAGNFEIDAFTNVQLQPLLNAINWIYLQLGRKVNIYPHQQFASTSCPGANVMAKLQSIKSSVQAPNA